MFSQNAPNNSQQPPKHQQSPLVAVKDDITSVFKSPCGRASIIDPILDTLLICAVTITITIIITIIITTAITITITTTITITIT